LTGATPGLLVSAAAGTLSFLSPCVLPLLPAYLAFLTGVTAADGAGD
jgi:cytochrome c-type biogenesis protein